VFAVALLPLFAGAASAGLVLKNTVSQGDASVALLGPTSVTISPDGKHLFATAEGDNVLVVFARDAVGMLSLRQIHRDDTGGVDGLERPSASTMSPDGKNIYITAFDGDGVTVFSRDLSSGMVTFVEVERDGVDGVDGLDDASSVVVSPDGNHVYVVGERDGALAAFTRDPTTGQLTFVEVETGLVAKSVAVSPDGSHVYTASPVGQVTVFARDASTGALDLIGTQGPGGSFGLDLFGCRSIALSPDGANVYVVSFGGRIFTYDRDAASGELTLVDENFDPFRTRDFTSVTVSPDGTSVYASTYSTDSIFVFDRDLLTGLLTHRETKVEGADGVSDLENPLWVTVSPDGKQVYAASRYPADAIMVFSRNDDGSLPGVLQVARPSMGTPGGPSFLAASADGYVYATTTEPANSLIVLEHRFGGLSPIQVEVDALGGDSDPTTMALSPDGKHLYVATHLTTQVLVFARQQNGMVALVESIQGNGFLPGITVSPEGNHVYVGTLDPGVYSRDPVTGRLTPAQDISFCGASVVMSPDGANLYAACGGIEVFSRNVVTGEITLLEFHVDGSGGVEGLDGANSVALSADGRHLYVTGETDDAVVAFERDSTGALTFVEAERDGIDGVDGLDGARFVTVSPNGALVYVAGYSDNAVAVFARDPSTGQLAFVQVEQVPVADSVIASPDGLDVYVGSYSPFLGFNGFLRIFSEGCGDGAVTTGEQCDLAAANGDDVCCTLACQLCGSGEICRASVGACDLADTCNGTDATCPSDAKSTSVCRVAAGACDAEERCDGVANDCPADAKGPATRVCRSAAGPCDVRDTCDGVSDTCPPDVVEPAGFGCPDDSNVCTNDICDGAGTCIHPPGPTGTACSDDSNVCTDDLCDGAGTCIHPPGPTGTACPDDSNVCTDDLCDGAGVCSHSPNTATCDDGEGCTASDTCQGGTCAGSPVADGTDCDDSDACTQIDACEAGACIGTDPVQCTPLDQCHVVGVCNPSTGACSDPVTADGTTCDDGNLCTQTDACESGSCAGSDPIVCSFDECVASECNPADGQCSAPETEPDGTPCTGDDANTCRNACSGGACVALSTPLSDCCGNGAVTEMGEQCDDGNQSGGDGCAATCDYELIPGNRHGSSSRDRRACLIEWSVLKNGAFVPDIVTNQFPALDKRGRPHFEQTCHNNDPYCDFDPDPTNGVCEFHVIACLNNLDPQLPDCAADGIDDSLRIRRPRKRRDPVNHGVLSAAFTKLRDPVTGEDDLGLPLDAFQAGVCTDPFPVRVALHRSRDGTELSAKRVKLLVRGRSAAVSSRPRRSDLSRLVLTCLP
jgi:cysteine-rich repeat protein